MNKVIMIDGKDSHWYEQAIFILKPDAQAPKDIVLQAEQIIRAYANKIYPPKEIPQKPIEAKQTAKDNQKIPDKAKKPVQKKMDKKNMDLILNIALIASCVMLGYVLHGVF